MPKCPECNWVPTVEKDWECHKCGAIFNTFKTGAICPSCGVIYKKTQCPECDGCFPYEEWFDDDDFLFTPISSSQKEDMNLLKGQ